MLDIKVDHNKRKEVLDRIEQDRIRREKESEISEFDKYVSDVNFIINSLDDNCKDKLTNAYELGHDSVKIYVRNNKLITFDYNAINNEKYFSQVFPPFIDSIVGFISDYVDTDKVLTNIMEKHNVNISEAYDMLNRMCEYVIFYFREVD